MPPDQTSGNPGHLSRLVADLEAAGVRPTPLAIISTATDRGLTDAEISVIVDELASGRSLNEVRP